MTRDVGSAALGRIGLLWRADGTGGPLSNARAKRLLPLMAALRRRGIDTEPVVYADDEIGSVRDRLLGLDGVLVWVNPIQDGANRGRLDALLREVGGKGVWVSAHPDVILKMGTKEVLFHTRQIGWGTDTDLYRDVSDFRARFPRALKKDGVRVLKQARGNGGDGVWKIELIESAEADEPGPASRVRMKHAMERDEPAEGESSLGELLDRCEEYFAWSGSLVDQAFQGRIADGQVRCYLVHDEVVGFGHQWPKAFLDSASEAAARPNSSSQHSGPDTPEYQLLRRKVEQDWVPQMKTTLDLDTVDLPAIWDADFLYGPKTPAGEDTYVLCEINVSAVWPYPECATERLAEAAIARSRAARRGRD